MAKVPTAILVLALLALLISSSSCGLLQSAEPLLDRPASLKPTPTVIVTPTLIPQLQTTAPHSTAVPGPDKTPGSNDMITAWQSLRPGLERKHAILLTEDGDVQERLYMLRIDPDYFYFDVGYKPGSPQRLTDWQQETGALIIVNGGYFTAENEATGLVIVNGQASGTSYAGFGGMLSITNGIPAIRSLSLEPYNPYESLQAGLQSFPLLIAPGGQVGYPDEDGVADRRTVIAQDRQGRILFILANTGSLTLHEMSRYLAESDLNIAVALNLDGGASTGIQLTEPPEGVAPYSLLPIVITVRPRG